MGVSTNADLWYGLEFFSPEDGEELPKPLQEAYEKAAEEYEDHEMLEDLGNEDVGIDYHSSSEYAIWFAYIKESRVTARRGDAQLINKDLRQSNVPSGWDEKLRAWADSHGIPFKGAAWHLSSYWG